MLMDIVLSIFSCKYGVTVDSEIFAIILFSRIALKVIFAKLKIRDFGMIYLHQYRIKGCRHFTNILFSRNSAYAKFRENKTLAKISVDFIACSFCNGSSSLKHSLGKSFFFVSSLI